MFQKTWIGSILIFMLLGTIQLYSCHVLKFNSNFAETLHALIKKSHKIFESSHFSSSTINLCKPATNNNFTVWVIKVTVVKFNNKNNIGHRIRRLVFLIRSFIRYIPISYVFVQPSRLVIHLSSLTLKKRYHQNSSRPASAYNEQA